MDTRDTLGMIAAIGAVVFMAVVAKAEAPRVVENETGIVVEYQGSAEPAAADAAPAASGARKVNARRLAWLAAEIERLRAEVADAERLAAQEGPEAVPFKEVADRKQRQLEELSAEWQALDAARDQRKEVAAGQGTPGDQQAAKPQQNYQNSRQEMKQQIRSLKMQRMMDPAPAQ